MAVVVHVCPHALEGNSDPSDRTLYLHKGIVPKIHERFQITNMCLHFDLWNKNGKLVFVCFCLSRKTLIGPTYGSPIQQVQILPPKGPDDQKDRYLAFINKDKVGLQILPVDGNPHKTAAIICHPDGVSNMSLSYDGTYVFTAGGDDHTVLQWEINLEALEAAVYLGGEDLTPFYGLLDGGREGEFYKELEDYFYYSQLRSQGIDTMETRKVSTHIPLSELPFVMRAIGFYPSEEEIDDMLNEVKFSEYVDTGELVDAIDLPDFVKVYINHRPPFGHTINEIRNCFKILGRVHNNGAVSIKREDFLELLLTKGQYMCLRLLWWAHHVTYQSPFSQLRSVGFKNNIQWGQLGNSVNGEPSLETGSPGFKSGLRHFPAM
uniref:WD repeat domain 66 n=1 Tax=Monodelphis domestica TaxID=13616 RepID=A0A5F8H862_MONDO